MTEVDDAPSEEASRQRGRGQSTGCPSGAAKTPAPALPRPRLQMVRYIVTRGWLHLILLSAVGVFLFPFVYMVGTSLKTDEELTESDWFPAVPKFVGDSPRVRMVRAMVKPDEASQATWDAVLPQLRKIARAAVDQAALPAGGGGVDAETFRTTATDFVVDRLVHRLNLDLWAGGAGDASKIIDAFKAALTADMVREALDDRLARLELRGLQARTMDSHIYNLTPSKDIASTWQIAGGDARFIPGVDGAVLRYHFNSGSDQPVVLKCAFDYPGDPQKLHKLMLAIRPDDSWHQVDATLDLGGVHWVSQKTKYLGTNRKLSILFQPPSFDDTTDRRRIWVPLKNAGPSSPSAPHSGLSTQHSGLPATLTLTLSPSSSLMTIWGKVHANYSRVFESIPFWRYIGNSLWIVALATLGTLFSSSFVAYAFARLNWPGRTAAFGLLLATMMLPAQVTMIPSFMIWRGAGLYNTLCPLWLPAWFGTAFFIFLMVQHMRTIPRDLEEAARIDGASTLRTWAQIIVPETKPALAAIAIMVFMGSWNEFMAPLIYLRDQSLFPLSLGLYNLRLDNPEGGTDWTLIMAGNVLMTFPVVLVFFLFQKYFVQGLTMTGMKG
jgi:ABC-type glycerol-3-phosphate transport system permease component